MAFNGWPATGVSFFEGLEADNSKAYWTDHRGVYDSDILAPTKALLDDLEPEFGEGHIYRPNRDIRFSADKSPYKTAISASLAKGGYLQFSASGLVVGAGCYTLAPDQLERYRTAVLDDSSGEALRRAISTVESSGLTIAIYDSLKTAPRGYPKDHPRADLLRNKSLAARKHWPLEPWVQTAAAEDRVIEALRASKPIMSWLDNHIGTSELARH